MVLSQALSSAMDEKSNTGTEGPPRTEEAPWHRLPFPKWLPLLAGVAAGLVLRLVYSGEPGEPYASAMGSFVYFSPVLVGAITVYVAESRQRRTWAYYARASFVANIVYVIGSLLIMIEGLVCAIIIAPLFAALGMLGGLLMGAICRLTNWPRKALSTVALLPLVLGSVEADVPVVDRMGSVERTILIDASPGIIWGQILNASHIEAVDVGRAWVFRIGVPVPISGVTRDTPDGPVRRVTMGKGIYFDQVITDWNENHYVRWTYRFYDDSFPKQALDDHVVIGGHYFDIQDTSYTLVPRGNQTELRVRMQYRVTTRFNWYADPVARVLLENVEDVNLAYYRRRSEATKSSDK